MAGSVLLIVLGHPDQRVHLNQHLRSTAYRLIYAFDGEDGFERFKEAKPDLVLAHVHAPRIDGAFLCSLIRKAPGGAKVPVILFGEDALDPSTVDSADAQGFLRFPFSDGALVTTIVRHVGGVVPEQGLQTDEVPSDPAEMTDPAMAKSSEITLDSEDDDMGSLDPALAAMARLADLEGSAEDDISITTDPRMQASLQEGAPDLLSEPVAPSAAKSHGSAELMPMFAAPPLSAEDLLEEPALPGANPGPAASERGSDTGRRLIEELPMDAARAAPVRTGGVSMPGQQYRGLDESQLGQQLLRRANETFEKLDVLDEYGVLGVDRNASAKVLRDAYFRLSLEFHPDRFFLLRSGDLKQRIYAIFRRITEAYAVLSDPRRRRAYDIELGISPQSPDSRPAPDPQAAPAPLTLEVASNHAEVKRYVLLAQHALSKRDAHEARMFLTFAQAYEPQNPAIAQAIYQVVQQRQALATPATI